MPKVVPEYLEQRKRQILEAAAACFTRRGFHQATMQDICEEVSLSPGAVYRYFRSKDEIIEAMCAVHHRQDVATIEAAMARGGTLGVLSELIRVFFIELEDRQFCALNVELLAEAQRNDFILTSIRRGSREILEALTAIIRRGQDAGQINPELDATAVARVMMSLYQGLLNQKLVEPEIEVASYANVMQSLFEGSFWLGPTGDSAPQLGAEAGTSARDTEPSPAG
jgi:AcrR family transcriptional regulator